ncbi:MAG: ribosome recycling factor [Candidatus Tectomicrobia bacterium]|uniref:Ribosome-recycling factor n=1 Tax=Tectimicrobiota bacterium TaxID=2528274 RepID=A0A937W0U6_UNCTE|nr:ribosome recycling factor [Candidatus Tectomicrobia bacterium]
MIDDLFRDTEHKMERSIASLRKDLARIRTGRASLALLEGITVDAYGTPTPLSQMATLAVPESRLITIQPWDKSQISPIEKSIQRSDLGLTPTNDGKLIRLSIPPLTAERRKDLVKQVKKMGEEAKVALRNVRREGNDGLKDLEKAKQISEDDWRRGQEQMQKLTDRYITQVDEVLSTKEHEILEV